MVLRVRTLAISLLLAFAAGSAYPEQLPAPQAGAANPLTAASALGPLREEKVARLGEASILSARLLDDFYQQRGGQLVWTDSSKVAALRDLAERSVGEGFIPDDFHGAVLKRFSEPGRLDQIAGDERVTTDIILTDALLRYVHHTRFGKLDPRAVDPKWNDRPAVPEELLIADMSGALDAPDMAVFLDQRFPKPFWYRSLEQAFGAYTTPAMLDSLPELPKETRLSKGDRDPWVVVLRERLRALGDKSLDTGVDADLFDDSLHDGLVAFQKRFGLSPDGVLGPVTLAAVNHPNDEKKADKIRINLERMRWLYNDLPPDYVFVDVAGYMGYVVRDREVIWSTRVIVGTKDAQTPMFRDKMEHVVFNPTWTVPISIQKTLGRVSQKYTLRDRRTGRKVSQGDASDYKRYLVVQEPGPTNALGRVKFIFPNRHSVYLHDTPSRGLFSRSSRALSHGCVRVQDPVKLAEILLGNTGWERDKINRVLSLNKTRYVNLASELPVLLYYLTARADESGKVSFRSDIYDRDDGLRKALAAPVLSARIAFPEPPPPVEPAPTETPPDAPIEQSPAVPAAPLVLPPSQNGVRLTRADLPVQQP